MLIHPHHVVATALDDDIDPEITGYEREVMLGVLADLPHAHRQNVVYIDAYGRSFVSRVRLRREVSRMNRIRERVYLSRDGEEVVFPQTEEIEPNQTDPNAIVTCSLHKGPFRRMRTKVGTSSNPFSYLSARVYLPSATKGEIKTGKDETPHIYSGGKSANGTETDAGFFHNRGNDNWALFTIPDFTEPLPWELPRIQSGQDVLLEFYVPRDNRFVLHTVAMRMNGDVECITAASDYPPAPKPNGWKADGIGNMLKRVTSIAQVDKYHPDTGAFFRNVHWHQVKVGKWGGATHLWSASDTGLNCVYPNTAKVYVDFRTFYEEFIHLKT